MNGTASATILVMARVGSRYETKSEQGISHVLEHMLFKGSEKWPTAKDIAQTLDGLGADYNAFTSKDQTGYYIKVAYEHLPKAMEVLSDMIWHPLLSAEELEREKKVICEEIKMYEDNPLMHIGDLLEGLIFANSSLGVNIAGSIKSVSALRRSQVVAFHRKFYGANNLLVVVAGKMTSTVNNLLSKNFSLNRQSVPGVYKKFHSNQSKPRLVWQKKDTQQVQLAFGFPAYGYRHKNRLALDLLAMVLGGNMSSRLFMRLREREGLCYAINSSTENYEGIGLLAIQAGLDKSRLSQAISLIKEELQKVITKPVSQQELTKAKDYVKGKMTLAMENSSIQAQWAARQYIFEHSLENYQSVLERLNRLTPVDLRRVAKEIFNFKKANLAIIGPDDNKRVWLNLIKP